MVRGSAEVDESVVIAVLPGDGCKPLRERLSPLELSAPESAEVAVDATVVVFEDAGVDGERAAYGLVLWYERALRTVGHGHAEAEDAVVAFGGEDEIVLAVLLDDIIVPHLFLGPFHLVDVEDDTVVGRLVLLDIAERQDMVVAHLKVSAVVVEALAGVPVVAGVDIEAAVEHVGRGVGHIVVREEVTWKFCHIAFRFIGYVILSCG